jgi:pyruvate dehydrogenase E2 component (dihydrolipoamide acetyltransferase)
LHGTGAGGVGPRPDVEAALRVADSGPASAGSRAPGFRGRTPGEVETVAGVRKRIVEKMERAWREIPHACSSRDVDVTELWRLRTVLSDFARSSEDARADAVPARVTPLVIICRAVVLGLQRFPTLNARYDPQAGTIRLLETINLGLAVDTERGLYVPNIKDAQDKSLVSLARESAELVQRCQAGMSTPADLTNGTFTVDNYGSLGTDDGSPIINAPEAAILGIGAIRERPWVVGGELAVRRVVRLTLAFDHRVCDGGEAGHFLNYVSELCEEPARALLHA